MVARINTEYYFKKEFLMKLPCREVIESGKYEIYSVEKSSDIIKNLESTQNSSNVVLKNNTIKVVYKTLTDKEIKDIKDLEPIEDNLNKENIEMSFSSDLNINTSNNNIITNSMYREGVVFMKKLPSKIKVEKLVLITTTTNKELPLDQYTITISTNMIVDVIYKPENLKIVYSLEEIKEPIKESVLEVWTSFAKKTINVLHIHWTGSLHENNNRDNLNYEAVMVDNVKEIEEKVKLAFNIWKGIVYGIDYTSSNNVVNSNKVLLILKNYKISKVYTNTSNEPNEIVFTENRITIKSPM